MKKTKRGNTQNNTKILSFTTRRGRPKSNRPQIDTGTPETIMKRLLGLTTEALDLCMERGIINDRQHWCGIHLRWLYTLRHGVPSVRANDLSYSGNCGQKPVDYDDPHWRAAREKEYNTAINALTQSGHALLLMNLCVYNEMPKSMALFPEHSEKKPCHIASNIRNGLDILSELWKSAKNT